MHTSLYSNWSVSFRWIIMPWSFLKEAYALASSYGSMHEDFQRIKTMLVCNGFRANFLDDCVRNFVHRLHTQVSCSDWNFVSAHAPHSQILNPHILAGIWEMLSAPNPHPHRTFSPQNCTCHRKPPKFMQRVSSLVAIYSVVCFQTNGSPEKHYKVKKWNLVKLQRFFLRALSKKYVALCSFCKL